MQQGGAGGGRPRRRGGGGRRPEGPGDFGQPPSGGGGRGGGGGYGGGPRGGGGGSKQAKDLAHHAPPKEGGSMHHHPPKEMAADVGYPVRGGQTLLIAYFPWEASEMDIEQEFSKFCRVKRVHLVVDKSSRKPRCFGFVKFMSKADAEHALTATSQGLVQLPDTRGHVWHLKAEWTRSGDMVVDDSETEQEVAKRKEERRTRIDRVGEHEETGGGRGGLAKGQSKPSSEPAKGALHPGVPAPLPPLQTRYPGQPAAALGALQGQLPMMHPGGQPLQQALPPPLAQAAQGHHPQQPLYGGYPGASPVHQGMPHYGGHQAVAGAYGGAGVPGGAVYGGLPGGAAAAAGACAARDAASAAQLDAPGLHAAAHQPAREAGVAPGGQAFSQPAHDAYGAPPGAYPPPQQGYAPAQAGYPAATGQAGYALPQGYPAQGFVAGQPGFPPEQPFPGAHQGYATQQPSYTQQGYPAPPQAYSQQGAGFGAAPPPGYPSQGYAPPGYPGPQPPSYGGYGQGQQAVPVQPGVAPQAAAQQQGSYGYLQQPSAAAAQPQPQPGVMPFGSGYVGGASAPAGQTDPSVQDSGAIAIATVPSQPRHQAAPEVTASTSAAGGAAPAGRNSEQEFLDNHIWNLGANLGGLSLHRDQAAGGAAAGPPLQPPPPAQQVPAPPAGRTAAPGTPWKDEAFRAAPSAQGDARAGADWAAAARGVAPTGGSAAGSTAVWSAFDDAAAKGMVDGLVGGEDPAGAPPDWTRR